MNLKIPIHSGKKIHLLVFLCYFILIGFSQAADGWKYLSTGIQETEDWSTADDSHLTVPPNTEFSPLQDKVAFLYQALPTEGELSVEFSQNFGVTGGILVRKGLFSGAATFFAGVGESGNLMAFLRNKDNTLGSVREYPELGIGWKSFRLTRKLGILQIFASKDGIEWQSIATADWNAGDKLLVGVGGFSQKGGDLKISQLELIEIPLSKLLLWFRADSGVVLDAKGRVREWRNQVEGAPASQAIELKRPELQIAADEKPVVWFEGREVMDVATDWGIVTNPQMLAVFAVEPDVTKRPKEMKLWNFGDKAGTKFVFETPQIEDDFGIDQPQRVILPKSDQWLGYSVGLRGNDWTAFIDGKLVKKATVGTGREFSKKLRLGGGFSGGIREFMVFREALSGDEQLQLARHVAILKSEDLSDPVGLDSLSSSLTDGNKSLTEKTELLAATGGQSVTNSTRIIFIDNIAGDDSVDGKALVRNGRSGPKKTLQSVLPFLEDGIEVRLKESSIPYILPDAAADKLKAIVITPMGNVILQSENNRP